MLVVAATLLVGVCAGYDPFDPSLLVGALGCHVASMLADPPASPGRQQPAAAPPHHRRHAIALYRFAALCCIGVDFIWALWLGPPQLIGRLGTTPTAEALVAEGARTLDTWRDDVGAYVATWTHVWAGAAYADGAPAIELERGSGDVYGDVVLPRGGDLLELTARVGADVHAALTALGMCLACLGLALSRMVPASVTPPRTVPRMQ